MDNEKNPQVKWWKSLLGKKWTFPAIYLIASVLIVTLMWTKSDTGNYQLSKEDSIFKAPQEEYVIDQPITAAPQNPETVELEEAVPVTAEDVQVSWPLEMSEKAKIVTSFYSETASAEERSKAVYEYTDKTTTKFIHSKGIGIVSGEEKFDVFAVANGEVTMAEEDALYGMKVKISHGDGLETVYASLSKVTVKVGDEVKAGMKIGQAGKSEIRKDLPNHLYFEAYKLGEAIDPVSILPEAPVVRTQG
ncbi:hypothetical protein BHU72_05055 [Desulfuribacillus stibiiarsenatis]|uniref:M23ase beta-sheet core domain-containing protein n=1 Tax=Desulfuribacillus stibiiarsenatis TaxID=1390249 RepID=A0A1E5L5R8_9FIRM|nr:M23 family metallopeptidase [Desulfuribacillus stibiiarsenatis]OEH85456.1 hypothetical protein BHU72_05055 [Desulfuribacillus stibiiarsenatis]